jgi:hypothetical protein
MERGKLDAISKLVARAERGAIEEAHLPMALIDGFMDGAEQILVLIGRSERPLQSALNEVGRGLTEILSPRQGMNILPMLVDNALVPLVREAGCKIFPLG